MKQGQADPRSSWGSWVGAWFVFCVFLGFKGQWDGPNGPKPSLFFVFLFYVFCFCFFVEGLRVRWGGLGPKPSLFFVFFFPFLSLLFNGHFCLFLSVSLCFSLAFFGLPLFQFLFLCLSLVLALFPSFLVFLFCFLLVPCYCLFLSFSFFFAFVSWKEQHQNTLLQICSSSIFSRFFGFLSCFLFQIPFSYLCYFLILSYVFCNVNVFGFQKNKWKNKNFGEKGSCNKRFFIKMLKVLVFFVAIFLWQSLVDVQKTL